MNDQFLRSLAAGAFDCLVVIGPLLAWSLIQRDRKKTVAAAMTATLFLSDVILVYLPLSYGAQGMAWAWQGKIFETAFFLFIVFIMKLRSQAALLMPEQAKWIPIGILLGFLYSTGDFWRFFTGTFEPRRSDLNVISYELTMPGIAEELSFRGVMLGILDEAFGRPVKILGESFGVGTLATIVLFYMGHGVIFDEHWHLAMNFEMIPDFLCFGFLMCWLRYKSGSILPCVLVHNINNGIGFILSAIRN
jgi:membrane protease YdiL (CAAX protease family)